MGTGTGWVAWPSPWLPAFRTIPSGVAVPSSVTGPEESNIYVNRLHGICNR